MKSVLEKRHLVEASCLLGETFTKCFSKTSSSIQINVPKAHALEEIRKGIIFACLWAIIVPSFIRLPVQESQFMLQTLNQHDFTEMIFHERKRYYSPHRSTEGIFHLCRRTSWKDWRMRFTVGTWCWDGMVQTKKLITMTPLSLLPKNWRPSSSPMVRIVSVARTVATVSYYK